MLLANTAKAQEMKFARLFISGCLAAALSRCNMQAANHAQIVGSANGDYKALAACVFDQRHRDRTDVFTSVNEEQREARIWQSVTITNSSPLEITFIQSEPGKVRVEVRAPYIGGPQPEFDQTMNEVKNCTDGPGNG